MAQSGLEYAFTTQWSNLTRDLRPKVSNPVEQCKITFDRDFRWDFAWIDSLVCLDVQGGGWGRGKHNREFGMSNDFIKEALAVSLGWRVFHMTKTLIENDPSSIINYIIQILRHPVLSINAEHAMWEARIANLIHVNDEIENNGITIKRLRRNQFEMTLSGKTYFTAKHPHIIDGQREALNTILNSGGASTPEKLLKTKKPSAQIALF